MATYSVHTRGARDGSTTLVREGFSFPAFLLGPIWFAWSRSWLGGSLWLLGIGMLAASEVNDWVTTSAAFGAGAAFHVLMALEASQFKRRALRRRGYFDADVVDARNRTEAEIHFMARTLSASSQNMAVPVSRLSADRAETVGLFFNGA